MSVVITKSVCFTFALVDLFVGLSGADPLDSIRFVIVCLTEASIMWFGQPGHQVTSDEVPSV